MSVSKASYFTIIKYHFYPLRYWYRSLDACNCYEHLNSNLLLLTNNTMTNWENLTFMMKRLFCQYFGNLHWPTCEYNANCIQIRIVSINCKITWNGYPNVWLVYNNWDITTDFNHSNSYPINNLVIFFFLVK